ncbi:hypothetical protein Plhal304r1_c008g0031701 [Plasmopara halstedii]
MIQTRATRAITKAIMAAGTAGTIASVYWLVSRIVDDNDYKRLNDSPKLTNAEITVNSDGYNEDYSEEEDSECYHCNRFRDLPVIFESDNEYTEDITGYTGDCYTPSNDICMLSVSIKTLDDSHLDVSSRECRLCEAAESKFAINYEDINAQRLYFPETECTNNESVVSAGSDMEAESSIQRNAANCKTEQWLYVRL